MHSWFQMSFLQQMCLAGRSWFKSLPMAFFTDSSFTNLSPTSVKIVLQLFSIDESAISNSSNHIKASYEINVTRNVRSWKFLYSDEAYWADKYIEDFINASITVICSMHGNYTVLLVNRQFTLVRYFTLLLEVRLNYNWLQTKQLT